MLLMIYLKKYCARSKTENSNLKVLNIITGINESKILTKHVSRKCGCKFHGRKRNSDQKWNNDTCRCERKKHHICEKDYIWNPAACSCENGKYLASIIDDLVITCDEILDAVETKAVATNFNEKYGICKTRNIYITCSFINHYCIINSY